MNFIKHFILLILILIVPSKLFANLLFAKAKDYFNNEMDIMLVEAAASGNTSKIDKAIELGANVNVIGKDEMTPLIWALAKYSKKGFEYLLKKGANPNYREKSGDSIMYYVSIVKSSFYLEKTLEYGGDPNTLSRSIHKTVIFDAILYGRIENVKVLVESGADINHQNDVKMTPLMYAASFNFYDIVFLLLEKGADIEVKTKSGRTLISIIEKQNINPRHWEYKWYIKCVSWLRDHGYKVNVEL